MATDCTTGSVVGAAEGASVAGGAGGAVYTWLTKPPGSVSVTWSSCSTHWPSTTYLNLIFSPHDILVDPTNPVGVFVRGTEHDHYKDTEKSVCAILYISLYIINLVESPGYDYGCRLRVRPRR